jgi:putative flippase GtrA
LGITAGFVIGGVNIPGFLVAVTNSFFWNKFWVFRDRGKGEPLLHDFPEFLAVTIGGALINSGIVIGLTTYVAPLFGLGAGAGLNVAKAAATAVTLFWNFAGYKFVVFRGSP